MREYKDVKKRALAIVLAVVTVISTWSADMTALAAGYSDVGQDSGWTITNAGQLAEVYTAQSTYEKLQDASFKMYAQEGESVGYIVSVYQNLTDATNPTSGVNVYNSQAQTLTGDGTDGQTATYDFVANGADINFAAGETYAVVIRFTQNGAGTIMYYEGGTNTNGFRKNHSSDSMWEANRGNMIQVNTTEVTSVDDIDAITLSSDSTINMALNGEAETLTATLSPAYLRQIYFNQNGNSVVGLTRLAYNQVSLQPMRSGTETIYVSTTNGDVASDTQVQIRVIDAQISTSSYEYTGEEIKPEVTFHIGSQTYTAEEIGATVSYSNNINVGTGTISISSSTYAGYQDELTFEITAKEITQDDVNGGSYSIDGASTQVTAANIGSLVYGQDFTASAVRTGTTASTITYEVTVTGIGNYVGTATTSYTVTAQAGGTLIDISDVVTATLGTTRYTYDTRQKEPTITFKAMDGSTISDFASNCLISYKDNVNAGTATVTITGNSDRGYTGTITKTFSITRCSVKDSSISITLQGGTDGAYPHTGDAVEPQVVVRLQTQTAGVYYDLVEGTDYSLIYNNNEEIGTASVKINGINNFSGNITKYYEIVGDFEKDTVVDVDNTTTDYSLGYVSDYETSYTGTAIEPEIYVSMGNASLNPVDDYTVAYENNVNAGQATVVITGQGEYAGKSIRVTFTISPITINRSLILANEDKVYTGEAITLDSSEYAINGLTEGVDYNVSYSNNINAGTATITATGIGNYTGSVAGRFTITPRVITDALVTVDTIPDQTYTGSAIRPTVTVYYNGVVLPTSSYSVSYASNTSIGTATATITGRGNLTGSRVEQFTIKAKTLESLTFSVEGTSVTAGLGSSLVSGFDTPYSGMEQKPSVTVKDGSTTLTAFRDYTVGYGNNINCGTANIYVMGNGAYAGSNVTITFTISPKDIASSDISVSYAGDNYKSGDYTLPNVTITDAGAAVGKQTLSRGTAYRITGTEECKTSGTGKIATITGIGNYTGTREVEYTIGNDIADATKATVGLTNPYDGTSYTLQDNGRYYVTYIGNEATPKVAISYDGSVLTSADYDVTYTSMTEANGNDIYTAANDNTIQVEITGKGDYYGSITLVYTMVEAAFTSVGKFAVTNATTGDANFNYTYDNETKTVNANVSYLLSGEKSIQLQEGVDYTLTPSTIGPEAGTTAVAIVGMGNYQGTMSINATIEKTSLADTSRITAGAIPAQEYTGYAIIPPYTLVDQTTGETLMRDEDFTVTFEDNVAVGTGKVVVTGINNYTGTRTLEFEIAARSLAVDRVTITSIDDQVYNGTALEPNFTIYYGATPLTRGVDYECVYTNNTAPGKAVITITGMGTYTGQTTANFNIIGDISDTSLFTLNGVADSYLLAGGVLNFDGETVTIKYAENTTLLSSSNYRIVQENCSVPGVGRITFVGQNYCTGARSVNVDVIGNLNEAVISDVSAGYDYTGNKITPAPKVTYGDGNVLLLGRDYTLTYGDNTSAGIGNGSITIQPVDGSYYMGSQVAYFDIQYNLDNAVITGPLASYKYTGSAINPVVDAVTVNGKELTSSEYTVSYGENIDAGTGQITISPNSGYVIGSKTIRFNIEGISLLDAQVSVEGQTNYTTTYTGNEIRPTVAVTYLGRALTLGTDYTVTYNNNINAGTGEIRILGTGNYMGALDKTFTITKKDLSASDVTAVVSSAGYAGGQPVIPSITLSYNGITLESFTDYTYFVSNNTDVTSSAVVTFTGYGNFTGNKVAYFEITQTDLSRGTVTVDETTSVYTGLAVDPHIRVSCPVGNGQYYILQEGRDYDITYGTALAQMVNVGSYMIQITGRGNFINSLNTNYVITEKPITSEDITIEVEDMDYTGSAVRPDVVVTDTTRDVTLVAGTDYAITYHNNINSASATEELAPTVTISGRGNYGGVVDKTFNIGESMEDATVILEEDTYTYDKQAHIPSAVVSLNGETLTEGVDYTVTYMEDVTNAGTKTVTIKGMGQYYGTIVKNYVIHKKVANSSSIVLRLNLPTDEDGNYIVTYTGAPVEPQVSVYDEEISTEEPLRTEDYTVEYVNNNIVGSISNPAYAVVSLTGNYDAGADTYRAPFIIQERDITEAFRIQMDSYRYQYTGEEITPNIVVTSNVGGAEVVLSPETDYDVAIENNVNAGKAIVTVTGKGNYSGEVTSNFDIYASLTTAEVIIEKQFYTGDAVHPPVTVLCGGNELEAGVDYTVAYYSDDNYTTGGYVIITPLISYYSDSATQTYEIGYDGDLLQVRNYANEYTYTGEEIKPTFIISTPSGTFLPYNPIDVTYVNQDGEEDCTNAGTVTAYITLTSGTNSITLEATYTIIPRNINTCDIMQLENNTYTGKALTPPAIVQFNGEELTEREYQVSYSNNVNPGVANAAVIGRGNFTGTKTLHFNIVSAAMINLKASPASSSSIALTWTRNQHVTGYQIYSEDSKTLYGTTTGNSFTVGGLKSGTEYALKVRSYVTVNGVTTFGAFKSVSMLTNVASTSITVKSISKGRATINWSSSAEVSGYEIYRSSSANGTYHKIAVMPKSAGGYTDSGLTSGRTYYYKVRAYKSINGSYEYGAYSVGTAITVK